MTAAGPVVLAVKMPATASGSSSTMAWSPSTPAATSTRSTWPRRAEASATTAPTRPRSVTSKVIVSTSIGPRVWSSLAAAARPISSRPTSTIRAQTARHQGAQHGPGDIRRPAHDHRALGHPHGVVHRVARRSGRARFGVGRCPGPTRSRRPAGSGGRHQAQAPGQIRDQGAVGVHPVPDGAPFRQARVHGLEQFGTQASVLGEIHAAPGAGDRLVERVEDRAQGRRADGEVDGEGPSRRRERERSGVGGTESLQHRQERRQATFAHAGEHAAQGVLGAEGDHELVLDESPRPVHAVPVTHPVEGVEVGRDRLELAGPGPGGLSEPHLVERRHRHGVEQPRRRGGRHPDAHGGVEAKRVSASGLGELVEPGVIGAGQHGATHAGPARQTCRSRPPSTGTRRHGRPCVRCNRRDPAPARCRPASQPSRPGSSAGWRRPRSRSGPSLRPWPRTGRGRSRERPRGAPTGWRGTGASRRSRTTRPGGGSSRGCRRRWRPPP